MAPGDSRYLRPYTQPLPAHDPKKALWESGSQRRPVRRWRTYIPVWRAETGFQLFIPYRTVEELLELSGGTCEDENDREQPDRAVGIARH